MGLPDELRDMFDDQLRIEQAKLLLRFYAAPAKVFVGERPGWVELIPIGMVVAESITDMLASNLSPELRTATALSDMFIEFGAIFYYRGYLDGKEEKAE